MSLVFCDTETTDLDERTAHLLEVAVVFTDDELVELAHMSVVIKPVGVDVLALVLDPYVLEMHTKNGLLDDVAAHGIRRFEAEQEVVRFIRAGVAAFGPATMAGSTIGFDLRWLRCHMPKVEALFGHRSIDVSSITELAKRWAPAVYDGRPKGASAHRALDDARESINYLRYYRRVGFLGGVR